jgi:hypothetical protein
MCGLGLGPVSGLPKLLSRLEQVRSKVGSVELYAEALDQTRPGNDSATCLPERAPFLWT